MNLLFCDRIAPRQALRVRSATQVILTPTPRSQLSYKGHSLKGHSLALPTSIFGSRADTGVSGQGPPQFYGEVPFPQATKNPRIYEPAGSCSSPVAPRRLPGQVLVESKHRLVPLDGFLPICVSPQMQKCWHSRSHRKAGSRRQCVRPPAQLLPTGTVWYGSGHQNNRSVSGCCCSASPSSVAGCADSCRCWRWGLAGGAGFT